MFQVPGFQLCFMLILRESDANLTCTCAFSKGFAGDRKFTEFAGDNSNNIPLKIHVEPKNGGLEDDFPFQLGEF